MSPASVFASGRTALITGGASGVGLAVAQLCRKHGMKVAVADYNKDTLAAAKESVGKDADVETYEIDVSKIDQWKDLKEKVAKKFGTVDFLMLNAGIGAKGGWGDNDYFHKIMDTNLFGVINGLNTYVPDFQSRGDSETAIIITGSKQGITNPPGNPAYNASKSAVKTLAEHLSYDLKSTKTSVHLLVPGWTFTGLSGNSPLGAQKDKPAGAWWPHQVADFLYQKMSEGRFYVLCPDNDVTEDKDQRRMLWTAGDAVYGRPPLTRWREEYKEEAEKWMQQVKL